MRNRRIIESHVSDAAYFAWLARVRAGASPESTPEQEKDDWYAGRREIEHVLGMVGLCRQLMHCDDTARKIRLAVFFFIAEERGISADAVTEQMPLPASRERYEYICAMVGNAAINVPFMPPQRLKKPGVSRKPNTVGQLIRLLQNRAREVSRCRTVSARKKQ